MKLTHLTVLFAFLSLSITQTFAQTGFLDDTFDSDGIVLFQYASTFSSGLLRNGHSDMQSDGKIVMTGVEVFGGSQDGVRVLRYNNDGTLDTTFADNGSFAVSVGNFENVEDLKIQPDGKILVSGDSSTSGSNNFFVMRLNSNGTLDTTFSGNGAAIINVTGTSVEFGGKLAIQPDGKIIVVGRSDLDVDPAVYKMTIVRLNTNGSLDTSFAGDGILTIDTNTESSAKAVGLQSDNKIIIGGFINNGINDDLITLRLASNGLLDFSYGTNGIFITPLGNDDDYIDELKVLSDNKILLTGTTINADRDIFVAKFTADGAFDSTLGNNGLIVRDVSAGSSDYGRDIGLGSDGDFFVMGRTGGDVIIYKFDENGAPKSNFGLNGSVSEDIIDIYSTIPTSLHIQNDGKPIATGISFNSPGSFSQYFIARFVPESTSTLANPIFDFDGDGKTDNSIFRSSPNPAQWWLLRSSDGGNNAYSFGLGTDRPTPADFTGDGKTDIAFFRESTSEWFVLRSEDFTFYSYPFGTTGDIPAPGDFDGDGMADTAVYRPSNGTWYIVRSSDANVDFIGFGISEDKPVVGDYDGDGMDDVAIYRPSNSQWWLNRSSDGVVVYQFGQAGDKTVQGDHTGDGKADVAFWRPTTGEWFVIRSEDQSFFSYPFGTNGDIPTPGDYDGDGTFDAAVFRPSSTTWFINGSTSGTQIVGFGLSDDIPLANSYVTE